MRVCLNTWIYTSRMHIYICISTHVCMYTWNPTDLFLMGWHNFRETNPSKRGSHLDLFLGLGIFFITTKRQRGSLKKQNPRSETTNIPLAICFSKQPFRSSNFSCKRFAWNDWNATERASRRWRVDFSQEPPFAEQPPVLTWWCFSQNSCKIRNWEGYSR